MQAESHLDLVPPLVESGDVEGLVKAGQTLAASWSPLTPALAIYVTSTNPLDKKLQAPGANEEQPIYFASLDVVPSSERRLFITDTLIIFSAFQNLLRAAKEQEPEWIQSEKSLEVMRKLAIDYVNFIKECWIHASQPITRPEGPLQFSSEHYRCLYTCFSLFVVLYLPEPGYEDAPVGDELMEWLNTHFIEPSTEEGDHLSSLEHPWEEENFWPYLTRATLRGLTKASLFFLGILSRHPSQDLQALAESLAALIESQPRLQNYTAERDFAYASRRWRDKVKALRIEMDRVPEDERFDDFDNWWDRLSDMVGILEGRPEVIKRVCSELGSDWKEVIAAWGVFVDIRLRRQDLSDVVSQVLDDMPPDPTSLEDMIHAALFAGEPPKVLEYASQLDRWLSAHFADIMEPLSLIEPDPDEETGLSLRDYHIVMYAEYLHSDPALWRVTVDYMYSCAEPGKLQADEILVRVPLRLHEQIESNGKLRSGDIVGVLKDVNRTCLQYQRESVRRTVCRIASQTMVQEKEYGLAVAYLISAEDWPGLGRVVDRVLEEYISSGPRNFAAYAAAIAPSIQELRSRPTHLGVFAHRLLFAVRYAHFHQLREQRNFQDAAADLIAIFREDLAPKSWWAVLLCDSVPLLQHSSALLFSSSETTELMRKLEEVFVRTSQGAGYEYISVLKRTVKGEGEALERLKLVRLALARYFARFLVLLWRATILRQKYNARDSRRYILPLWQAMILEIAFVPGGGKGTLGERIKPSCYACTHEVLTKRQKVDCNGRNCITSRAHILEAHDCFKTCPRIPMPERPLVDKSVDEKCPACIYGIH
ncbi:putative nup85 Nucleoporin [Lyophyllum shimeji]|uniref:Nuclear pore complex protein Nup85 n=1 Tax=Lyophyllum shimeji TaxID=47721 RepID=A0A9P3US77_LYOSH|nr:putative nup85 Nucleoporin [Lyophyllum shimeji]